MEYSRFPTERPDEDTLVETAEDILSWHYVVRQSLPTSDDNPGLIPVERMKQASGTVEVWFHAPPVYADHLAVMLFRLSTLAFFVKTEREETLRIRPYLFWVILAQNFAYLNNVLCNFADEVKAEVAKGVFVTADWRSWDLDRYIVTEVVHGRHEPAHVIAYRLRRDITQLNLSQAKLQDIDMNSYKDKLVKSYPHWSGHTYRYTFPIAQFRGNPASAKAMLEETRRWYKDDGRIQVYDHYTDSWAEAEWEPKDPFDPNVVETGQEEVGNKDGRGRERW